MRTTRTRAALGALAATALLSLAACGGSDGEPADETPSASSSPSADAAAELEGIPEVVAEVNGEEVTRDEFAPVYQAQLEQAESQAQTGGAAPDEDALRKQTVDDLVDTELLAQEADSRGIEVDDADIDAELTELAEQNGMASADELVKAVEEQGLTEDQARSQVGTQVMVEQLVEDENGPIEPTDKELRALYAQARQQQEQAGQGAQPLPPFGQVRSQLEEQARTRAVGEVASRLLEGLRKDADITINL